MAKTKKEPSLEETFQELEEVTLDDSFSLYEQWIQKLKFCNEKIDHVEKKMLLLNKQGELEAFDE